MLIAVLVILSRFLALSTTTECSHENCLPPNCSCFSTDLPGKLGNLRSVPQLVMLGFDDAVHAVNYPLYQELLMTGRRNKGNGCPIRATFFVTHEYTNYHFVHQLHRNGNEIAVHSITHSPNTEHWRVASMDTWQEELVGMRQLLSELALVPKGDIVGVRAPFLQTSGNPTFTVLKEAGFLYDCSMPTRSYRDPPAWPYTLDHGFLQDCAVCPCPNKSFPGLWILPLVTWERLGFHCAMPDACTPYPETVNDTMEYLKSNFKRHYETNRAPFPFFLHHAWLQNDNRKQAYFDFVDWLLEMDDVFFVTARQVIAYMQNTTDLEQYVTQPCPAVGTTKTLEKCSSLGNSCYYPETKATGPRYLVTCRKCPRQYPWTKYSEKDRSRSL